MSLIKSVLVRRMATYTHQVNTANFAPLDMPYPDSGSNSYKKQVRGVPNYNATLDSTEYQRSLNTSNEYQTSGDKGSSMYKLTPEQEKQIQSYRKSRKKEQEKENKGKLTVTENRSNKPPVLPQSLKKHLKRNKYQNDKEMSPNV